MSRDKSKDLSLTCLGHGLVWKMGLPTTVYSFGNRKVTRWPQTGYAPALCITRTTCTGRPHRRRRCRTAKPEPCTPNCTTNHPRTITPSHAFEPRIRATHWRPRTATAYFQLRTMNRRSNWSKILSPFARRCCRTGHLHHHSCACKACLHRLDCNCKSLCQS